MKKNIYTLKDVKLKKINAINRIDENIAFLPGAQIEYKVEIKTGITNENPKFGLVIVGLKTASIDGSKSRFDIDLEYFGLYEAIEDIEPEDLRQFSLDKGYYQIWPYVHYYLMQLSQTLGISVDLQASPPIIKQ